MTLLPLVSVIIPAYNAAAFIAEAIESVLNQTYRNIEVLVVDDGSQDETPDIVRTFVVQDARVILLQQTNQGVAAARNLAIARSRGEFIAPIDADDIWYPQKLEKQVQCIMQSDSSVGLVYAWSVSINENSAVLWSYYGFEAIHVVQGNAFLPLVYYNFLGNASTPLIRRICFEKIGSYNIQLRAQSAQGCEDLDLYLRIAEHYHFAVVPEFLIGYRQSTGSMSSNLAEMEKSYRLVLAEAQRKVEIPADLMRWSQSYFNLYLGLRASTYRNYNSALGWLYRSVKLDPLMCLHPFALRVALRCAVMLLLKLISNTLWRDPQVWERIEQLLRRKRVVKPRTLAEAAIESTQLENLNLYYWIFLKRWSKVLQLKPTAIASSTTQTSANASEAILPS